MARTKAVHVPEVGDEAPDFNLSSAQGGRLRLGMRVVVRGPVVVVFYRGAWSDEDVEYFKALAEKEDEINLSLGSVVGIGVAEPSEARAFVRESGIKSYVLYDYSKTATREWGLLESDKEHGEYARPAVFIVGTENKISHAWVGERPDVGEIQAKVSEITGLPKPPEGEDEKQPDGAEKPSPKLSPEEREKRRAERKAAREEASSKEGTQSGKEEPPQPDSKDEPGEG